MKRPILTLVVLLAPSSAFATSPDLCTTEIRVNEQNEPYIDSRGVTLSVYCEWTGPGAPVWDDDLCCSFDAARASCVVPESDAEICDLGMGRYFCAHGEPLPEGGFICYQEFGSACEAGFCVEPEPNIQAPEGSTEDALCCIGGACYPWDEHVYQCEGEFLWCQDGYSKADGTVECFD